LEAEQSVLGAVFLDNEALATARRLITTLDFYREPHRILFQGMCGLADKGAPIDAVTIRNHLRAHGQLELIGGPTYIAELVAIVPSASSVQHYAAIVREAAIKRRIASDAGDLATMAFDGVSAEALVGEMWRRFGQLDVPFSDGGDGLLNARTLAQIDPELLLKPLGLGALYDLFEAWQKQAWVWEGILPHGSLSLLVGKSESGKSTLVCALIYCIIRGLKFLGRQCERGPVLYLAGDPASEYVAAGTFQTLGLDPSDGITVIRESLVGNRYAWPQFRKIVDDLRPILIVLDTLAAAVDIDTEKYGQSQRAQQPLTKLARDFSPNILSLHHSQKSAIEAYNVVDAALGSVGVAASASTRMVTRMYRRARMRFHTIEMSNLRIGQPLEGEWIVNKLDNGLVELDGLWSERESNLLEEAILKIVGQCSEPITQTDIKDRLVGLKLNRGLLAKKLADLVREGKLERTSTGAKKYGLPRAGL
jgi:hypothetical protein